MLVSGHPAANVVGVEEVDLLPVQAVLLRLLAVGALLGVIFLTSFPAVTSRAQRLLLGLTDMIMISMIKPTMMIPGAWPSVSRPLTQAGARKTPESAKVGGAVRVGREAELSKAKDKHLGGVVGEVSWSLEDSGQELQCSW